MDLQLSDGIILLLTIVFCTTLAFFVGRMSARKVAEKVVLAQVAHLQQQQNKELVKQLQQLKMKNEASNKDFLDQVDARFQIMKAEFAMFAQDHIQEMGRKTSVKEEVDDDDYEEGNVVLKTRVGEFM